jgi:hypothetical protein
VLAEIAFDWPDVIDLEAVRSARRQGPGRKKAVPDSSSSDLIRGHVYARSRLDILLSVYVCEVGISRLMVVKAT